VKRGLGRVATVLGVVLVASAVQLKTAQQIFEQQERVASQRLMKMTAGLIEYAHEIKDDLMIQGITRALGESPGMLFACVIDGENRILAHNQPSRLGRTLKFGGRIPGTWSCLLQERNNPWGRLVFRISRGTLKSAHLRLLIVMILVAAILAALFLLTVAQWQSKLSQKELEKTELMALLDAETKKACSAEERRQASYRQNLIWLQNALDQNPNAMLLLDERQRIVALNQRATVVLSISRPSELVGTSWQDVPSLRDSGPLLVESIEKPGKSIRSLVRDGGLIYDFMTINQRDLCTGTWVTFLGADDVVK